MTIYYLKSLYTGYNSPKSAYQNLRPNIHLMYSKIGIRDINCNIYLIRDVVSKSIESQHTDKPYREVLKP